jgi:hypothetical protein
MTIRLDTPETATHATTSVAGPRFSRLFPLLVGERQSTTRGLRVGWYAIDNEGAIVAGPYPSRDECVERIGQTPDTSIVPDLWRRPDSVRSGAV